MFKKQTGSIFTTVSKLPWARTGFKLRFGAYDNFAGCRQFMF